jgi:hypothetical protein
MTDINLKTLTPDTSLPTTGFLFGADSQATTDPSVYSTQTVATTLLGSTSLTGDTLTASAPVLDLAQTWSNISTVFTGIKLNVTNTNSASGSMLMDLQIGGTTLFNVDKIGSANASRFTLLGNNGLIRGTNEGGMYILGISANGFQLVDNGGFRAATDQYYGWGALGVSTDTFLRRSAKGAANVQLGAADAATALAQTLSVQSVVAGTTNGAGAAFTINGSQGTGTGVGGSIIFQVAPAGGSGTAQNALVPALTIASSGASTFTSSTNINVFNVTQPVYVGNGIIASVSTHNGPNAFTVRNEGGVTNLSSVGATSTWVSSLCVGATSANVSNFIAAGGISFSSGSSSDLILTRVAAGIIKVAGTSGTGVGVVVTTPTTVGGAGGLPAAATAGAGARAFVTDATMSMTLGVGTVVVGGGANAVPVYSDGTNWLIG